jgi:hypothetical protein
MDPRDTLILRAPADPSLAAVGESARPAPDGSRLG